MSSHKYIYNTTEGNFRVSVKLNNKKKYLGTYDKIEFALKARNTYIKNNNEKFNSTGKTHLQVEKGFEKTSTL